MTSFAHTVLLFKFALFSLVLMMVYWMWQIDQNMTKLTLQVAELADEEKERFGELKYLSGRSNTKAVLPDLDVHIHNTSVVKHVEKREVPKGGIATALPPLANDSLTYLPNLDGENVVSMSLYGSEPRYTQGAIRNAEIIKIYLPGWKLRVYVELPSDKPMFGPVPKNVLDKLRELDAVLNYMDPHESRIPPMMWRFLIADDLSVDRFIVRDTDSRLSPRDAAAIYMWVKSGKPLFCIRDHPSHSGYPLSGGLWGGSPSGIRDILRRPWKDIMYGFRPDYFQDMSFLINVIWPRMKDQFYCSDSFSCDKYASSHPFPIPRYGYEHVGQVYDSSELSRPGDIRIIRDHGENPRCSPPRPKL